MANTSDSILEDNEDSFSLSVLIPVGIAVSLLILSAIVGNILTIIAFFRDHQLHTVYNMYIVNLALTDFLLGLVSMTFYAVYTLSTYSWPFGYHFCKIYMVIDFTLCLESILMMIIISWDRCLLLYHGPHYTIKETPKIAGLKIAISWVIAFALYGPAIIGWDLWTGEDTNEPGDCDVQFAYDFVFTTTTAVIEFVIPVLSISALNVAIYWQIRKRTSVIRPTQRTMYNGNSPHRDIDVSRSGGQEAARTSNNIQTQSVEEIRLQRSVKKNTKAAKFLAALVVVFVVTWAPYTIATIIISFCDECVDKDFYEFLNWLLWSKASVNPFLYAVNSSRFLYNFKKILWCFNCLFSKSDNNNVIITTVSTNAQALS